MFKKTANVEWTLQKLWRMTCLRKMHYFPQNSYIVLLFYNNYSFFTLLYHLLCILNPVVIYCNEQQTTLYIMPIAFILHGTSHIAYYIYQITMYFLFHSSNCQIRTIQVHSLKHLQNLTKHFCWTRSHCSRHNYVSNELEKDMPGVYFYY